MYSTSIRTTCNRMWLQIWRRQRNFIMKIVGTMRCSLPHWLSMIAWFAKGCKPKFASPKSSVKVEAILNLSGNLSYHSRTRTELFPKPSARFESFKKNSDHSIQLSHSKERKSEKSRKADYQKRSRMDVGAPWTSIGANPQTNEPPENRMLKTQQPSPPKVVLKAEDDVSNGTKYQQKKKDESLVRQSLSQLNTLSIRGDNSDADSTSLLANTPNTLSTKAQASDIPLLTNEFDPGLEELTHSTSLSRSELVRKRIAHSSRATRQGSTRAISPAVQKFRDLLSTQLSNPYRHFKPPTSIAHPTTPESLSKPEAIPTELESKSRTYIPSQAGYSQSLKKLSSRILIQSGRPQSESGSIGSVVLGRSQLEGTASASGFTSVPSTTKATDPIISDTSSSALSATEVRSKRLSCRRHDVVPPSTSVHQDPEEQRQTEVQETAKEVENLVTYKPLQPMRPVKPIASTTSPSQDSRSEEDNTSNAKSTIISSTTNLSTFSSPPTIDIPLASFPMNSGIQLPTEIDEVDRELEQPISKRPVVKSWKHDAGAVIRYHLAATADNEMIRYHFAGKMSLESPPPRSPDQYQAPPPTHPTSEPGRTLRPEHTPFQESQTRETQAPSVLRLDSRRERKKRKKEAAKIERRVKFLLKKERKKERMLASVTTDKEREMLRRKQDVKMDVSLRIANVAPRGMKGFALAMTAEERERYLEASDIRQRAIIDIQNKALAKERKKREAHEERMRRSREKRAVRLEKRVREGIERNSLVEVEMERMAAARASAGEDRGKRPRNYVGDEESIDEKRLRLKIEDELGLKKDYRTKKRTGNQHGSGQKDKKSAKKRGTKGKIRRLGIREGR
ncbi:hypothetical protein ONS95_008582 [Cadophora gregata]|uniref:uncharacterized protein n=1 Tax=Cadophora gregata TaxID=51156 RepID=UPI0026DB1D93|nr:uncharacterized protein ONS95_008582 [Cadophora gregata]KAK0099830.1 hypothetical protein ONS95_008582 [Cadophora gregata]